MEQSKKVASGGNIRIKKLDIPIFTLNCGKKTVREITSIPNSNLIVATTNDGTLRIYSGYNSGRISLKFEKNVHKGTFIAHLFGALIASIGYSGKLRIWDVKTGEKISETILTANHRLTSISKRDEESLCIGDESGNLYVVLHDEGRNLKVTHFLKRIHSKRIHSITQSKSLFATSSSEKSVIFRHNEETETLKHDSIACSTICKEYFIIGNFIGDVFIHQREAGFPQIATIHLSNICENITGPVVSMAFIKSDTLMVTTLTGGIFILSMDTFSCVSHLRPATNKGLTTSCVLSDGRICVGGSDGYLAIFRAPSNRCGRLSSAVQGLQTFNKIEEEQE